MKKRNKILALAVAAFVAASSPVTLSFAEKRVNFFSYSDTRYNASIAEGNGINSIFSASDFAGKTGEARKEGILVKFKDTVSMESISSIVSKYNVRSDRKKRRPGIQYI